MTNAELAILLNEYNETVMDVEDLVLCVTSNITKQEPGHIKSSKNRVKLLSTTLEQLYDELNDGIGEIINSEEYSSAIKRYWVDENTKIITKKTYCNSHIKAIRFLLKSYKEDKPDEKTNLRKNHC